MGRFQTLGVSWTASPARRAKLPSFGRGVRPDRRGCAGPVRTPGRRHRHPL